ncbi:MAG: hydroxymethylglutaryl-CoA reductase, partial [Gammaproteobacteria bacterium]|nr:hydroxymethylglutaryl-CoA reductase [Gammaproteobacteria bacterium]
MTDDRLRIPEFYKLSVDERVRAVHERGRLTTTDFRALATGKHTLELSAADRMIENVVGVMGLPLGLGMNLVVNDKEYIVPMVVEEPSVVAALGSANKLVRQAGGFKAKATDPILIGQIQIVNLGDIDVAKKALNSHKREIISLANSFHPNMVARGG